MRRVINIRVTVLTDGPESDVQDIADQMTMCLEEGFQLITDDLEDDNPIVTVHQAEIDDVEGA